VHQIAGQLPAELEFVIDSWADLPEEVKEKIVELTMRELKKRP